MRFCVKSQFIALNSLCVWGKFYFLVELYAVFLLCKWTEIFCLNFNLFFGLGHDFKFVLYCVSSSISDTKGLIFVVLGYVLKVVIRIFNFFFLIDVEQILIALRLYCESASVTLTIHILICIIMGVGFWLLKVF